MSRPRSRPARTATGGWVPIPDPTTLTASLVDREMAHRKEVDEVRAVGFRDLIAERHARYEDRFRERDLRYDQRFRDIESTLAKAGVNAEKRADLLAATLTERFEAVQRANADLTNVVVGLRASLVGQDTGADDVAVAQDRTRSYVTNAALALIAAVALIVSVYSVATRPRATVPAQTPSSTAPSLGQ